MDREGKELLMMVGACVVGLATFALLAVMVLAPVWLLFKLLALVVWIFG